jgi:hypothetical protein
MQRANASPCRILDDRTKTPPRSGHCRRRTVRGCVSGAKERLGYEADFQGTLRLDHAVAVGVFRLCAHGKLFPQQLAAAGIRDQRNDGQGERRRDQPLLVRRRDRRAARQSGAWPIRLHRHCRAISVRGARDPGNRASRPLLCRDGIGRDAFRVLHSWRPGNNAASGLLYPTQFRSSGVGWALGIGRLGSIGGPLVGGLLVSQKVPLQQFFLLAAVPMVAGLIASAATTGFSSASGLPQREACPGWRRGNSTPAVPWRLRGARFCVMPGFIRKSLPRCCGIQRDRQ